MSPFLKDYTLDQTSRECLRLCLMSVKTLEQAYSVLTTTLQVQYRFPKELAEFPSQSFYEGKLKTRADSSVVEPLLLSAFPWIAGSNGLPYPVALVNCDAEESEGGRSKSNQGQVDAVIEVLKLLSTRREGLPESSHQLNLPKATVLTPYTAQVRLLKQRLQGRADVFTVDSFQGRESDIIVFSSVRCNVLGDFGFLEDERRLNVMWTRAKLGLVLVGSKGMLERNQLWKKAVASARQVPVSVPVPLN
ncbi:AAA domain-containing protein [Flagelloscypha sp. PMI_526]|nr:AAA domain-containing protein [Flagelloscypha sp. PMI_526]